MSWLSRDDIKSEKLTFERINIWKARQNSLEPDSIMFIYCIIQYYIYLFLPLHKERLFPNNLLKDDKNAENEVTDTASIFNLQFAPAFSCPILFSHHQKFLFQNYLLCHFWPSNVSQNNIYINKVITFYITKSQTSTVDMCVSEMLQ